MCVCVCMYKYGRMADKLLTRLSVCHGVGRVCVCEGSLSLDSVPRVTWRPDEQTFPINSCPKANNLSISHRFVTYLYLSLTVEITVPGSTETVTF